MHIRSQTSSPNWTAEIIASPLAVIPGQKELLKKNADEVKAENVEAVVLGLPLNMNGSEGFQTKLVLRFAEQLKKRVLLYDSGAPITGPEEQRVGEDDS